MSDGDLRMIFVCLQNDLGPLLYCAKCVKCSTALKGRTDEAADVRKNLTAATAQ
jgi:hypothetical protein